MDNTKLATKPHYPILDALRGVAAFIVVFFHLAEPLATGHLDNVVNHGYLAVDFFFLLSGYVIGYAYDDRWGKLTIGGFLRRRFERLQPLVILGMTLGAIGFYFTDSTLWPNIHTVPLWKLLVVWLIGCTILPIPLSMDIRGWEEMHPLNSVGWSLFFEYIANILYALGLRKLSNKALACFVALTGALLLHFVVTNPNGDVTGGWTLNALHMRVGITRTLFPFFAGLLLSRIAMPFTPSSSDRERAGGKIPLTIVSSRRNPLNPQAAGFDAMPIEPQTHAAVSPSPSGRGRGEGERSNNSALPPFSNLRLMKKGRLVIPASMRTGLQRLLRIKNAFLWCSLLVATVLLMPRIGGAEHLWLNGLYEALCIIVIFPLIVYLGACGGMHQNPAENSARSAGIEEKICKFLGDLSYPLYMTHYVLVYFYVAWVSNHKGITLAQAWPRALLTFTGAILLAYLSLKFYDEPVRAWLRKKLK